MKEIFSDNAPPPGGHYSQAIEHNGLLYISGQLPIDPKSQEKRVDSIGKQTKQVLANLEAILIEANSGKENVLKVTVYISDIALWDRVNSVYAEFFGEHRPARAIVPTRELHFGFQIEVEAVAWVKNS